MEYKNKIIFTIEQENRAAMSHEIDAVRKLLNADTILKSNSMDIKNVSFVVDVSRREDVEAMAATFKQETILVLSEGRAEKYHLNSGVTELIGSGLTKVDSRPVNKDFFIEKDSYYIIS